MVAIYRFDEFICKEAPMKNRVSGKVVVMAIVLLWASCAYADILDFFLTDGSNEISFQLDSDPIPSSSDSNSFLITGVDLVGNSTLFQILTAVDFYPSANFGGLAIIYPFLQVIDQGGPEVFTRGYRRSYLCARSIPTPRHFKHRRSFRYCLHPYNLFGINGRPRTRHHAPSWGRSAWSCRIKRKFKK